MPTHRPIAELEAMVGESVQSVEGLAVEASKVREFARALRDENPIHQSESVANERGFSAPLAPLTFVRSADFEYNRTEEVGDHKHYGFDLGFDERYEVHGEESYEFERPLEIGDVLDGVTTLEDVYQREGREGGTMTFVVLKTEYYDQHDDLVVTQRTTTIETSPGDNDE